jgi:hypothetical protein
MTSVLERKKTVQALDSAATLMAISNILLFIRSRAFCRGDCWYQAYLYKTNYYVVSECAWNQQEKYTDRFYPNTARLNQR